MIDDEHLWDIASGEPGPAIWADTRGVSVIRFFRYGTTYDFSVLYINGRELKFFERSLNEEIHRP